MGWSSGSSLFSGIIDVLKKTVDDDSRHQIYEELIELFEDQDCDTLSECLGEDEIFDEVWYEMYPEDDFDDDEDLEWIH